MKHIMKVMKASEIKILRVLYVHVYITISHQSEFKKIVVKFFKFTLVELGEY